MAVVLEASSYFDPLAVATLVNLCRKGVCTMYSYNRLIFPSHPPHHFYLTFSHLSISPTLLPSYRWKKVLGLAIDSFKGMMKQNQLQATPPTNICYEFCSINDWDLARSVVALFVNCLTGLSPSFILSFMFDISTGGERRRRREMSNSVLMMN